VAQAYNGRLGELDVAVQCRHQTQSINKKLFFKTHNLSWDSIY